MLKLYERLTSLVEKLPGGVQKPILRELDPLRELFLEQRPARLLIVGGAEQTSAPAMLHFLCGVPVETGELAAGWRTYRIADRGAVEVLDGRATTPGELVSAALAARRPDVVIFLGGGADVEAGWSETFSLAVARIAEVEAVDRVRPGLVALSFGEAGIDRLGALLNSRRDFPGRAWTVFRADADQAGAVAEAICETLPNDAKLEFARLTRARAAQAAIASSLLKSFTAVCGVIGVQPIPLADLPILTTLQSLLVGMIVYVSGRRASARLIAEFAGALGLSIGVGFAFREGARALLKVFPIWGNAISGIVAGAGTFAVGRAAIAYFIEDLPLQETRKLFHRLKPGLHSFKERALPLLPRRGKEND